MDQSSPALAALKNGVDQKLRAARVRSPATEANLANASTISRVSSRVRVAVEPTNEEWIAAAHALLALR